MPHQPEKVVRVIEEEEFTKLLQSCNDPVVRPIKPNWLTREFGRLVKKAGIAACTIHDLRRSWSTLAQRAGIDRFTVKDLGGWSSVSVVERHYTGDVSVTHRRAMDKIAGVG
jgi:integrase